MELLSGLVWTRPLGFIALILPLVVLVLAFLPVRPRSVPVGTFVLWRGAEQRARGRNKGRRVPPSRWFTIAALVAGAVALAGPEPGQPQRIEHWRVLVDRSPSMFLPANGGPQLRVERAAHELLEWAKSRGEVRLGWRGEGLDPRLESGSDPGAPPELLEAPRIAAPSPQWHAEDEVGTLWLTDAVPALEPVHAGLFASGGVAVPGPVAVRDGRLLVWTPDGGFAPGASVAPPTVVLDPGIAADVAALVEVWAAERGARVTAASESEDARGTVADARLRIALAGTGEPRTERVGRDGWWARATLRPLAAADDPAARVWLAGSDGAALVRWRPGRIELGLERLEGRAGDPSEFAVSWAELLDAALLPPREVTALSERVDAGAPLVRPPRGEAAREAPERRGSLAAALCALAAGLTVLAMLFARAGR